LEQGSRRRRCGDWYSVGRPPCTARRHRAIRLRKAAERPVHSQFLPAMMKVPTRTRSELSNARSAVTIRDLTDADAEALEQALGKPIDRKFLVRRVSQITREIVGLAIQPKPQDYRPELRRIAQQGRVWIRNVEECPAQSMLRASNFEQMKIEVTRFCDQVDAIRRQYGSATVGPPRRRLLLQLFIGEMIGIAKRSKGASQHPKSSHSSSSTLFCIRGYSANDCPEDGAVLLVDERSKGGCTVDLYRGRI
jgi:hypothetical protein